MPLELLFREYGLVYCREDEFDVAYPDNGTPPDKHAPSLTFVWWDKLVSVEMKHFGHQRFVFTQFVRDPSFAGERTEEEYRWLLERMFADRSANLQGFMRTVWGSRVSIRAPYADPNIVGALAHEMSALLERYGLESVEDVVLR